MMKHRFVVRWQLGLLLLFLSLVPLSPVSAAVPSLNFKFVYKTQFPLTLVKVELWECEQADCAQAALLKLPGPRKLPGWFDCEATACRSTAVEYKDYHRLVVTFSDGVTRESNVFGKRRFSAFYRVVVHEDVLVVQEGVGSVGVSFFLRYIGFLPFWSGVLICLMAIFLRLVFLLRGDSSEVPREILFGIWLLGMLSALLSIFFSASLILTLLIEGVLVFVYVNTQGLPRWRWMTYMLVVNLISQPVLYILLVVPLKMDFYMQMVGAELLIWIGEAGLFYLLDRQRSSFAKCRLLSFGINFVSFAAGWLLAI